MASHHRERRVMLQTEQKLLARQKPFAWLLILIGGALFLRNYLGIIGKPNITIETICMIVVLMGGFWLWHLRSEKELISRRSVEQANEDRDRPPGAQ
jgi:hypothetical protein